MAKKASAPRKSAGLPRSASAKTAKTGDAAGSGIDARKLDKLARKLAAARARITELESRADTDFLLDILNRRGFERELRRSIAYLKRYQARAAVIYLDVDGLKPINDRFGHPAGDALLKAIAQLLTAQVRLSDTVARLGGDEFGLLLWNLDEQDAVSKALDLEAAVEAMECPYRNQMIRAGASAGVTVLVESDEPDQVLARADQAMYERKKRRRAMRSMARTRVKR